MLACQPFILYRSESVRFGPNIKGDDSPLARDRDAKPLRDPAAVLVLIDVRNELQSRFQFAKTRGIARRLDECDDVRQFETTIFFLLINYIIKTRWGA